MTTEPHSLCPRKENITIPSPVFTACGHNEIFILHEASDLLVHVTQMA